MHRSDGPITPRVIDPGCGADGCGTGGRSRDLEPGQATAADLDVLINRGQAVQRPGGLAGLETGPGRASGGLAGIGPELYETPVDPGCGRASRREGRTQVSARGGGVDPGRDLLDHSVSHGGRGGRDQPGCGALDSAVQSVPGVPKRMGIHHLDPKCGAQSRCCGGAGRGRGGALAVQVDRSDGIGKVLEAVWIAVDHAAAVQADGRDEHHDWTRDEAGLHKLILTRQDLPPGSQSALSRKVNPFIMIESRALPVVRSVAALREALGGWRRQGLTVGFVPTMGALHEGHLTLVREAGQRADRVVASVFVNPTQFAAHEDLGTYPRQEARDAELLAGAGCDLLFAPSVEEMYPAGATTTINVGGPAEGLEGAFRPQMFGGVALVVAKLLNQVQPDVAVFGEKDWQQLMVVRRLVRDLDLPTVIIGSPTMRDDHGLALSSRNAYLSGPELEIARRLNGVLAEAGAAASSGRRLEVLEQEAGAALLRAGFSQVDYVAVRRADDLAAFTDGTMDGPGRILVAAWLGRTRLIDNMAVAAPA